MDAHIASLHLYPVKGARGVDVGSARIGVEGLDVEGVGDREWMVVDAAGQFISQRSHHRLALVACAIHERQLVLAIPGQREIRIGLDEAHAEARDVVVWRSAVRGFDEGDDAANALSAFLGDTLRLVRFDSRMPRPCNPEYAGDSGAHTRYADGYPVLVIGAESLRELNARLARKDAAALPMNRFRPNVVVDGLEAFDEDHVDTLAFGEVVLKMVKPCIRCEVPTIDQATAITGIEPLLTLSAYRQHATLPGIHFGMNAIVTEGAGSTLATGVKARVQYAF